MAKGFEGLVSDEFAKLFFPNLLHQLEKEVMYRFAGESVSYDKIKKAYARLSLTELGYLLGAFRYVNRKAFVHPRFQVFAQTDAMIPVWHRPDISALVNEALAELNKIRRRKRDISVPEYENLLEPLLSLDGVLLVNTSQPMVILGMLALANLGQDSTVLEVGSGCGYLVALAAGIAQQGKVYGVEKIPALAEFSQKRLSLFGNVRIYQGDALEPLPTEIPQGAGFDAIIFSAGTTDAVARRFAAKLKTGGRVVAPIEIAGGKCALAVYARTMAGCDQIIPQEPYQVSFTPLERAASQTTTFAGH